jgi:hypothetical protein
MTLPESNEIPEPLRTVLRDYLHVEWYEIDELAIDVKSSEWVRKVGPFKSQLRDAILVRTPSVEAVHAITSQEFENQDQLVNWLREVWASLYDEAL